MNWCRFISWWKALLALGQERVDPEFDVRAATRAVHRGLVEGAREHQPLPDAKRFPRTVLASVRWSVCRRTVRNRSKGCEFLNLQRNGVTPSPRKAGASRRWGGNRFFLSPRA